MTPQLMQSIQLLQMNHLELSHFIAQEVEKVVAEHLSAKRIYPNVDFYSGVVYTAMGLPPALFTPMFAIARVTGWLAHWLEQLQDNRIYRPDQIYTGKHGVPYIPIEERA